MMLWRYVLSGSAAAGDKGKREDKINLLESNAVRRQENMRKVEGKNEG